MIRKLAPMLPVADIGAACAFLEACFGMRAIVRLEGYAECASGDVELRLVRAPPDADMEDPARQLVLCLDVEDVDALYARHRGAFDALPPGHLRPPFDQPYGRRELHAIHGPFLFVAAHEIERAA